ncbi:hypothetical protein ARMGADRAFT_1091745 [Armillaria gallica]|uniref:Uncharacterized protein n=1 Tax=Armillaria gallica TaxID=47427 RepID=A0A2H3CGL9_ARMGA|nr:hypothetical protein ARMGADRAFT_1091745 [Armillaria gallica]
MTQNTKFPWKLLKAETLRSICRDLGIRNTSSIATTKDAMACLLEQIQDFGHLDLTEGRTICFVKDTSHMHNCMEPNASYSTSTKRPPRKSKRTSARRIAKTTITGRPFKPKKVVVELPRMSSVNRQEFRTMVTHNSSQDQTSHVSPPLPESDGCENQEENTTSQSTPKGNEAVQTEEAIKIEEETVKLEEENVKLEEINHTRPIIQCC